MKEIEDKIKNIVKKVDKFKLIDIISSVYYYYIAIGDYDNMITTVELEYMINYIYITKSEGDMQPTEKDVNSIINLINLIIKEKYIENIKKTVNEENIIFAEARNDFLYEKQDKEYESIAFEYLNLFNPVEYFFKTFYSFKIEDFLKFMNFIQIEYVSRMKIIDEILKKTHKYITREILIKYLLTFNCNILNFNEKTFLDSNNDMNATKNILKKFSTNKNVCERDYFENYPIFKEGDTYIVSSIVTLINKAKYIFEKEIRKDKILRDIYAEKKGEYLEILTVDVIKKILKDADFFPNIKYRENKNDRECDLLVVFDQIILIIEIKGRAFKEVSKVGNRKCLSQDLNDNIYKAYNQATRMEKYLKENDKVLLRFGMNKEKLKLENIDKFKIFKIGITLENFRKYAIQYAEFNKGINNDMIFLNINDLKFIAKFFKYQTEFIHYISQRIKTNHYINKFYLYDELYLFSEYKINNLQCILNNEHEEKIFDQERYKLFDLRFDEEKKEKILKGKFHPLLDKTIKQMEIEKHPSYTLTIMELLDLDFRAQEYIFQQLKIARWKFKETRETIHTGISVDEGRDSKGVHIIIGVSDKNNEKICLEGAIILGSIFKRKYPSYEVIAIMNNIEDTEYKITQCLKIMKPKEDFEKCLNKIEELKNIYINCWK